MIIITTFLLSVGGCGYKAPPYYEEDTPKGDKNVAFHIEKQSNDTNESCE